MRALLKKVWKAAAALIIAGASVAVGLQLASDSEGMTCKQWATSVKRLGDVQSKHHFFLAVQQGAEIPKARGDWILGECSGGTCTIGHESCTVELTYTYDCGPLTAGWRLCEVYANPVFARGWREVATEQADFRWYKGLRDVVTECLNHFTGQQCLDLLDADNRCWLLDDGNFCRYGREYGPGLGGVDADGNPVLCRYARVQSPMPCTVNRGAGSEMADVAAEWAINPDHGLTKVRAEVEEP
jgi:hypothetical protein